MVNRRSYKGIIMATYSVKAPDGSVIKIKGPDGASQEEVIAKAQELYSGSTKVEEPSTMRKLGYGFAASRSDLGNLGDILESYIPLGTFFNPTETYGEEFMQMNPEQRREFLTKRRMDMVNKEYADVIAANEQDSWAATIGSIGGSLVTPTTLLPIGQGYKAVAATSALLGAEASALDQYMKTGEVDLGETAKVAAGSAVFGTGAIFAGRSVKNVYNKIKTKKATATGPDIKQATDRANTINDLAYEARATGIPDEAIPDFIQQNSNLSKEEIAEAFALSEVKADLPTLAEVKLVEEVKDNGLDTISRIKSGALHNLWKPVADRLEEVSPKLALRLRKVDMNSHLKIHERLKSSENFVRAFDKLNRQDKRLMKSYLLNGQFDDASKLMDKVNITKVFGENISGRKSFDSLKSLLKEIHSDLVDAGYTKLTYLDNYFPRQVRNLRALKKTFGKDVENVYQKAINARKRQLKVSKLPAAEEQRILNEVAMGRRNFTDAGASWTKERKINVISDEQLDMYADPLEGLFSYIRSATNNAEKRRFFKGSGVNVADDTTILDLDKSVGKIVQDELKNLDPSDADLVQEILRARFQTGEVSPNHWLQKFRSATYMTKLANPFSALTQLADLSSSAWVNGVGNTLASILGPGTRRMTMQKFGLDEHLAEEFANDSTMAKALHKMFTASGFRSMDKFGKNVYINSTLRRVERMVKSDKGIKKLTDKHGKEFGNEWTQVVNDLKSGNITENVKLLLWSELAKVQPISLSEMPLKYLQSPNGRVAYALKTFAAKQLSNTIRRTKGEWDKGNKGEAVKNLATWALTVPTTGMGVDELKKQIRYLGEEMPYQDWNTLGDVAVAYGDNVLKLYGSSSYMVENLLTGEINRGLGGISFFAPGVSTVEAIGQTFSELQNPDKEVDPKILKELPIAGQIYYYWLGGGIEADYNKAMEKEKRRRSER